VSSKILKINVPEQSRDKKHQYILALEGKELNQKASQISVLYDRNLDPYQDLKTQVNQAQRHFLKSQLLESESEPHLQSSTAI